MTDAPTPPQASSAPHTSWSLSVLSDTPNRTILTALGGNRGRPLSARAFTDRFPPDTTPRLVRDRLRTLTRVGLVDPSDPPPNAPVGAPVRWALTTAGEELVSLHALMARIASNGAGLDAGAPTHVREAVTSATLTALADPIVVEIVRCLAGFGPLTPEALEARCHPTPRRTLYRRLDQAVKGGAVIRDTTRRVPRSTIYSLADQWRPAGTILLLAAWWEARHLELTGPPLHFDLEGLLLGILPVCRISARWSAEHLAMSVDDAVLGSRPTLTVTGGEARVAAVGDPGQSATTSVSLPTEIAGSIADWTAAIVNDRRDGLRISGDVVFAGEMLSALRSGLLSYIR